MCCGMCFYVAAGAIVLGFGLREAVYLRQQKLEKTR